MEPQPPLSPPTPLPDPILHNKLQAIEKLRKDFCSKVRFSEVSHHLLSSEYLGREDCVEICLLPLDQQMNLLIQKFQTILEAEAKGELKKGKPDFWTILLRSLNVVHSGLTVKLDTEFHKLCKKEKKPLPRLKKEDISGPENFMHVKHIGNGLPFRRFFSLRSQRSSNTSSNAATGTSILDSVCAEDGDLELVKAFFARAGATQEHLDRPGSRKLILDFIESSGGMGAIRREMRAVQKEVAN